MSRKDTGKTSRVAITLRILLAVTPLVVFYHMIFGNGFNADDGWEVWKIYVAGYGSALFGIFSLRAIVNTWIYYTYRNDLGWLHWYRSGGDPFFDCLYLFNWDSWETRCASPMLFCPVCGNAMPNWNCTQCAVWFDGKQFLQQPRS